MSERLTETFSEARATDVDSATHEPPSIRGYRARKLRPCDNCRVRRKRCLIPEAGQACSLCVQTRKECTFQRKRPAVASTTAAGMSDPTPSTDRTAENRSSESLRAYIVQPSPSVSPTAPVSAVAPQWSLPIDVIPSGIPSISDRSGSGNPLSLVQHGGRPSQTTSTSALLERILLAWPAAPKHTTPSGLYLMALDDEAALDEELYLVGTASERDALFLNNLTMSEPTSESGFADVPGLRIRIVAPNVSFVFYKSSPYDTGADDGHAWRQVEAMVGSLAASEIIAKFFAIEGQGLPIFNPISHFHLPDILRAFCLAAGVIYAPAYRHLHASVYLTAMRAQRHAPTRARLWTLQVYLLDLNGREAINPSGNFVVLGMAASVARLLGLHEDCGEWLIPEWEKVVRTRLWWALLSYDRLSAFTFGRPRTIHDGSDVPLPSRGQTPSPSLDAFISLCELATIVNDLPGPSYVNTRTTGDDKETRQDRLRGQISTVAVKLDEWKFSADTRGLFGHTSAPGVQSLYLIYLGARLVVVRASWDAAGQAGELSTPALQLACQQGCLQTCQEVVDFVCALSDEDLANYWSSHCPFILSFCLTLLVRLIMSSDRTNQDDDAMWQVALFALRRFVSALAAHLDTARWDIAKLALSRARHFIPVLARQAAELQVALWPLQKELGTEPPVEQSIEDFINSIINPMGT